MTRTTGRGAGFGASGPAYRHPYAVHSEVGDRHPDGLCHDHCCGPGSLPTAAKLVRPSPPLPLRGGGGGLETPLLLLLLVGAVV